MTKMNLIRLLFGVLTFFFFTAAAHAQLDPSMYLEASVYNDDMPVPEGFTDLLFYVQRSKDQNTVIYELNKDESGKLIEDDPIRVFWVKYEDDSSTSSLSFLQRRYAYGVDVTKKEDEYKLKFSVFKKRDAYLRFDEESGNYYVYTTINKKKAVLQKIFVEITGGSFMIPKIGMVDFYGSDPKTGEHVHEKFDY